MGVESIGVESTPDVLKQYPRLKDCIERTPQSFFVEVLESKDLNLCAGANRMGPCVFGLSMATQKGDGSTFEGPRSSSHNSSSSFRFGECAGASCQSSTNIGYATHTVSVSELLAFRSRAGKDCDKQMPTLLKDPMPDTSSISVLNISSGDTTIDNLAAAFSTTPLVVASGGLPLAFGGREFITPPSSGSIRASSSFSTLQTSSKPSTLSRPSGPYVFSAGASDARPLKPGLLPGVSSGRLISHSRPASQSTISTDGLLFSGTCRSGVQLDVPLDSFLFGPMGSAKSNDTSRIRSCETNAQFSGSSETSFSVPSNPAAPLSGLTAPPLVGRSNSLSQFEVLTDTQPAYLVEPTGLCEESVAANAEQSEFGGPFNSTMREDRFAGSDQDLSAGISRKLQHLNIASGINLFLKLKDLSLDKDREVTINSPVYATETEVESSLEMLSIGEGDSLPLNKEKLAVDRGGNDFFSGNEAPVSVGQSTGLSGARTSNTAPFVFGGASIGAGSVFECAGGGCLESPPATNISSFKFSAEGESKPRVAKAKISKFQHWRVKTSRELDVGGKKSAPSSFRNRSEAATSSPSSDGVVLEFPSFEKPLIPGYDGDIDGVIRGATDMNTTNRMNELEAPIQMIRAAVSVVNLAAGSDRDIETSGSMHLSDLTETVSWPDAKVNNKGVSSPVVSGQALQKASAANSQTSERAEQDGFISELNDGDDLEDVNAKNLIAGKNGEGTENSNCPESSNFLGTGQRRVDSEGKKCPFTFTASSTKTSTSKLRRRTRRVQRSLGRARQGDKATETVLQLVERNSGSLTTMTCGSRSGTTSGGCSVGSGHREGSVILPGVGLGVGTVAEEVCERWRLRGNQAYAKGDFVKAEEFYSLGAESVSPHENSRSCIQASLLCYSNRAATRMVVGRMREALADCMHALAVDPSFARVHLRAAGCHLSLGETELATVAFNECLRQAQEASQIDSRVLADASEGLKKAQQVSEHVIQARELLRNHSSGDLGSALRLLNEALLVSPYSEWLLELKALTLVSLQKYSEGVQVCIQTSALAEKNIPTFENASNRFQNSPLGWRRRIIVKANFHLGKLEEALEQLQHVQEGSSLSFLNSNCPGALSAEMALPSMELIRDLLHHKLEGNEAFQARKYSEAVNHYTAALARSGESRPFCAICLCNRAAAFQAMGQIPDALADCSRAIALDPRYAKAISRRASLYEQVRDYGQSCCDLRRLIAMYERQCPQLLALKSPRVDRSAGSKVSNDEELQHAKGRLMKVEEEMTKGVPLDHYSILGLEAGCSASEIKRAYRKAALRHHPDKAGQFLIRNGDTGDDFIMDAVSGTGRKDAERLIDEVRKDSEQLFKLIGEAYAVLSDPANRSRYDSEEELRKFRTRSSDRSKKISTDKKHSRTSDGADDQAKGGWSSYSSTGEPGGRSRASRQRERWEGFNHQYQRWHPGPDSAQPDVYAPRDRPTASTDESSQRSTFWRWDV